MESDHHQAVSKPIIRNGYKFQFEFNGLSFRAGGSSVSGKEAVYVNDELVSSKRSQSTLSEHEFSVDGNNYKLEFEVLDKSKGELACRLYCEDKLVKLFASHPKRLFFTKPLFGISVIVALLIHDDIITSLSLSHVFSFMAVLLAIEVIYPMRHIWIMELEV
ncbi:MAG: hypothetical protein HND53_02100 [Proteobacteria bacterium]|nr:hypothetical protein [Pseudomonadota bacterium]NOG59262.1 hypothetical protein [Pseudomonadota bacterium]